MITKEEYEIAYYHLMAFAQEHMFPTHQTQAWLATFFGFQDNFQYYQNENIIGLSPEGERRVKLLAGPHHRTLLKSWLINQEAS